MTPAQHEKEAQALMARASSLPVAFPAHTSALLEAQVHATLAVSGRLAEAAKPKPRTPSERTKRATPAPKKEPASE